MNNNSLSLFIPLPKKQPWNISAHCVYTFRLWWRRVATGRNDWHEIFQGVVEAFIWTMSVFVYHSGPHCHCQCYMCHFFTCASPVRPRSAHWWTVLDAKCRINAVEVTPSLKTMRNDHLSDQIVLLCMSVVTWDTGTDCFVLVRLR